MMMMLWFASTDTAEARQVKRADTISVTAMQNGKPINVRAFALQAATKPKEGTVTSANSASVQTEEDDERKRAVLYIDDFGDGSVNVLLVVVGAPMPPEVPNAKRRRIDEVVLHRGASYVVDVGTGSVTSTPSSDPAAQPLFVGDNRPQRVLFREGHVYISGSAGGSLVTSTADFCAIDRGNQSQVGFQQGTCGVDANSATFSGSAGLVLGQVVAGLSPVVAGGYGGFGRNQPFTQGSRATQGIQRQAVEEFEGPWLGVGARRNWERFYVQFVGGAAWLTRDTSSTDTFTLSGQVLGQTTTTRTDTDVRPYLAIESGIRLWGPLSVGFEYANARLSDERKTQYLHRTAAVVRFEQRLWGR
jgi:hypothetical protein